MLSFLVEQVIKPKKNKAESEKTSDKPKKKKKGGKNGKDRKNKKKKNPCEAEYKTFCIHGECKYIEHLKTVTCRWVLLGYTEFCVLTPHLKSLAMENQLGFQCIDQELATFFLKDKIVNNLSFMVQTKICTYIVNHDWTAFKNIFFKNSSFSDYVWKQNKAKKPQTKPKPRQTFTISHIEPLYQLIILFYLQNPFF